jgi:hypothetical protein
MIEYALERLQADPSQHDKLEFELIPTCLDFGHQEWEQRYLEAGLCNTEDLAVLRESLRQITRAIIARAPRDISYAQYLETECPALEIMRDFSISIRSGPTSLRFSAIPICAWRSWGFIAP